MNRNTFGVKIHLVAVFSMVCAACGPTARSMPQKPSNGAFVPGQILIHFQAGTEEQKAVRDCASTVPLDLSSLNPVAERLGSRVATPLVVEQLQSGDWVLFAVDAEKASAGVAGRMTDLGYVEDARLGEGSRESIDAPLVRAVEVRIRRNAAPTKTLRAGSRNPDDKSFRDWIAELEAHTRFPLVGSVKAELLHLRLDLQRLTPELLKKVQSLPEVEAAQLNQQYGPK